MTTYDDLFAAHKRREADALTAQLFAPLGVPTAPVVTRAEQRELAIESTLQAKYEAWRATEDGETVYTEVVTRIMRAAAAGTERIAVKFIVESVRNELRISVNNSYTALLIRDVLDRHPEVRPLVELRERKAA